MSDKLDEIFLAQIELMKKYHEIEKENFLLQDHNIPVKINTHKGQARIRDLSWRIVEELSEAVNHLKLRPWTQGTRDPINLEEFQEELADVFHFMVELMISVGIDGPKLHSAYFRKHKKNKERQDGGY